MTTLTLLRPAALVAASLALMAAAAPACARPQSDQPSVMIRVSDINFNTASGAHAALGRIEAAAGRACGGEPDIRLLERHGAFMSCRQVAIRGAVTRLDKPLLTALLSPADQPQLAAR